MCVSYITVALGDSAELCKCWGTEMDQLCGYEVKPLGTD